MFDWIEDWIGRQFEFFDGIACWVMNRLVLVVGFLCVIAIYVLLVAAVVAVLGGCVYGMYKLVERAAPTPSHPVQAEKAP